MSIYILVFVLFMGIVVLIKNAIVYRNTTKADKYIFDQPDWKELLEIHHPSDRYYSNFFHPLKWTYKQMFDEIHRGG